jgi:hypothetical protein
LVEPIDENRLTLSKQKRHNLSFSIFFALFEKFRVFSVMNEQYQQTFTTTDGHNNVTYIQFVADPTQSHILYCKEEQNDPPNYSYDDTGEETYLDEDEPAEESVEVLESVVVERKKQIKETLVTKKLQVKGRRKVSKMLHVFTISAIFLQIEENLKAVNVSLPIRLEQSGRSELTQTSLTSTLRVRK